MTIFASSIPLIPDILLPFLAAIFYCVSIILVKYASQTTKLSGESILVINNLLLGAIFIPPLFFENDLPSVSIWWQPLLASTLCAVGNIATFICAERGEVSLMTPIMGIKIIFVILLSSLLLNSTLGLDIVISGAICCAAVFIMGYSKQKVKSGKLNLTLILALTACTSYAACDVVIQKYAPNFTSKAMIGLLTVMMPLSIIHLIPNFVKEAKSSNLKALAIGISAALLMVMEMFLMFSAITSDVGAALCNILYNSRGLISVILILAFGKFVPSLKELSNASALQRSLGAILIFLAVAIALYGR